MPHRKPKALEAVTKTAGELTVALPPWAPVMGIVALTLLALFVLRFLVGRRRSRSRREISEDGYVLVAGRLEHRMIAEEVLGRRLAPGEVVHHINGIRTDNRHSNLCVMDADAHEDFHGWIRWKANNDGRYPAKRYQRAVLRYRYGGTLLVTYPGDLPPLEDPVEPKRRSR